MKDVIELEEVSQAAKYSEYLKVLFGAEYDVIPVLVLTRAADLYQYVQRKTVRQKYQYVQEICYLMCLMSIWNSWKNELKKPATESVCGFSFCTEILCY